MSQIAKCLKHLFLGIVCSLSVCPYIIILIASFNNSVNIRKGRIFSGASIHQFIENLRVISVNTQFSIAFKNTLIVTIITVVLGLFISSLAGYAYVVYKNRFSNLLFYLTVISIMVPPSILLVPSFILMRSLGLLDSIIALSLTSLSVPLLVYYFHQNATMFPSELINAARIDGLSEFAAYLYIYIPNMLPSFVTAGLLLFFDTWNAFLFPLIIVQSPKNIMMTLFLNSYGTSYTTDYGAFMLLLLISMLPTVVVFIFTRKHFFKGLSSLV